MRASSASQRPPDRRSGARTPDGPARGPAGAGGAEYGALTGAVHAPRGLLELYADPSSPYHREELDPARRTILYCASGGRSALAAGAGAIEKTRTSMPAGDADGARVGPVGEPCCPTRIPATS